jgi:hypothetical protein
MPNAKPPRNLTPALCQRLSREMLKACQNVVARHGLVVEAKEIVGVDVRWGFDQAFRVSIPLPDGTALDPERLLLRRWRKPSGCLLPTTAASSALAARLFGLLILTPAGQNTRFQQNASLTGRGSSSRRIRWCYCFKRGCVT